MLPSDTQEQIYRTWGTWGYNNNELTSPMALAVPTLNEEKIYDVENPLDTNYGKTITPPGEDGDDGNFILPQPRPRAEFHYPEEVLRRRLYVGPEEARSEDLVDKFEIGAIVSLGHTAELYNYCVLKKIEYYHIVIDDVEEADITPHLHGAVDWIHGKVAFGTRVLVHCQIGRSRSPSICIAYLMKYCHMSYKVAFAAVNKARDPIYPNKSFVKQLKEWGKTLN